MDRYKIDLRPAFIILVLLPATAMAQDEPLKEYLDTYSFDEEIEEIGNLHRDFDACSTTEGETWEKFYRIHASGEDLEKFLEEDDGVLSLKDQTYIYFVKTKDFKKILMTVFGKCAIAFPNSSGLDQDELNQLINVFRQAEKELQRRGRENQKP